MMNLALVFTAALIIFAEKTLPDSHRIARPLGTLMVAGAVVFLAFSLIGGTRAGMDSSMDSDPVMESSPSMDSGMDSM